MGVSSTARLPSIGAQSIPQLFNHLQVASNAKVISRWNVTIRSFRAVPVPTNVWPADTTTDSTGRPSSSSSSGPAPLTKPRTMWQIWLSDYPGVVFIIVEDAGKSSRAKVWRDWEEQKRSWRARKRQHKSQGTGVDTRVEVEQGAAMDVDGSLGQENPGAKPELQVPSHTRYSVTVVTSSMSSMLTSLNLPPPHGAPVGTAGPGAWVPRGAAVSIEGLVLEISSQNMNGIGGLVGAASLQDSTGQGNVDWRVRVGSVVGGGGRSAGAVVEAEFLPMSALLPTSSYLHNFLQSLFPPHVISNSSNGSTSFSTAQAGQQGATATASTSALATPAASNMASYTYVIGPNAKLVGNTPNSSFNIPVISDQLWEEVVPRSGATWRNLILSRSQKRTQHTGDTSTANASPFAWHSFGPDGETNAGSQDSDSDAETIPTNGLQKTVTQQEDDDDDDRPLGAPSAKSQAAPDTSAAEIQLTFEGLRTDFASDSQETSGWTGIERGRRVAFHYVQMLRAEGII